MTADFRSFLCTFQPLGRREQGRFFPEDLSIPAKTSEVFG